jgi:hypothetical protein
VSLERLLEGLKWIKLRRDIPETDKRLIDEVCERLVEQSNKLARLEQKGKSECEPSRE